MMITRRILISVLTVLALLLTAGQVMGDGLVPIQNGADVEKDRACFQGWVDVGSESFDFFPNGEGLVVVPLPEGAKSVTTPSGTRNVSCKGTLPLGAQVAAIDAITGDWIIATLATYDEACDAATAAGWDTCPGKRGPWFGSFDRVGVRCSSSDDDTGRTYFTEDWLGLVTVSGRVTFNCHFDIEQ